MKARFAEASDLAVVGNDAMAPSIVRVFEDDGRRGRPKEFPVRFFIKVRTDGAGFLIERDTDIIIFKGICLHPNAGILHRRFQPAEIEIIERITQRGEFIFENKTDAASDF